MVLQYSVSPCNPMYWCTFVHSEYRVSLYGTVWVSSTVLYIVECFICVFVVQSKVQYGVQYWGLRVPSKSVIMVLCESVPGSTVLNLSYAPVRSIVRHRLVYIMYVCLYHIHTLSIYTTSMYQVSYYSTGIDTTTTCLVSYIVLEYQSKVNTTGTTALLRWSTIVLQKARYIAHPPQKNHECRHIIVETITGTRYLYW
jgi:hypothetical protein